MPSPRHFDSLCCIVLTTSVRHGRQRALSNNISSVNTKKKGYMVHMYLYHTPVQVHSGFSLSLPTFADLCTSGFARTFPTNSFSPSSKTSKTTPSVSNQLTRHLNPFLLISPAILPRRQTKSKSLVRSWKAIPRRGVTLEVHVGENVIECPKVLHA